MPKIKRRNDKKTTTFNRNILLAANIFAKESEVEIKEFTNGKLAKAFIKVTFCEYKFAKPPAENLMKTGATAHEITLPLFGTDKTVSLSDYRFFRRICNNDQRYSDRWKQSEFCL